MWPSELPLYASEKSKAGAIFFRDDVGVLSRGTLFPLIGCVT